MSRTNYFIKLILRALLCSWTFFVVSGEECNILRDCPGPVRYYTELKCKPNYQNENDCCPISYDCSHLRDLPINTTCYVNDNEYAVGEYLKDEDKGVGTLNCQCTKDADSETARMSLCTYKKCRKDYSHWNIDEVCYFRDKLEGMKHPCDNDLVCVQNIEDRPKCVVDGKTYLDGYRFTPKQDPDLNCICVEGYKGNNVSPFCKKQHCNWKRYFPIQVKDNCAPIYSDGEPLNTCTNFFRCPKTEGEVVISRNKWYHIINPPINDQNTCKFGLMTLYIGDELKNESDKCVKCTCEVPPTLSCRKLFIEGVCDVDT